jgi:hypothetical protein
MPAKSAKQERFMQAVAHNPAFAKKAGVPQSVGKEFMKKPKKFARGGLAEDASEDYNSKARSIRKKYEHANLLPFGGKSTRPGIVDTFSSKKSAEEAYDRLQNMREEELENAVKKSRSKSPHAFKKGGTVKESKAMMGKEIAFMKKKGAPKSMVQHEMAEAGMKPSRAKKYARGGGIEIKGKTRGKMC